jgi:hypothetical protein
MLVAKKFIAQLELHLFVHNIVLMTFKVLNLQQPAAHASPSIQSNEHPSNTKTEKLTTAARSICPAGVAGFEAAPGLEAAGAAGGRGADGTGGLPGGFVTPGLAPTGGGAALGFIPTGGGGGFPASELVGLELAAAGSDDEPFVAAVFFHAVADPLPAIMPGNTATGLADASAATDFASTFDTEGRVDVGAAGAAGAAGTTLGFAAPGPGGGGGGGGGAA